MPANIHVIARNDRWAVLREGGIELLSDLTEDEAIDAGREMARLDGVGFVIYGPDGKERESYSYEGVGQWHRM